MAPTSLRELLKISFGGRRAMLEVQNLALIKTAEGRAKRILELEEELQQARLAVDQKRELDQLRAQQLNAARDLKHAQTEVERLTASAEQLNAEAARLSHELAQAQGELVQVNGELEHAKRQIEDRNVEREFYRAQVQELEQRNRELTEAATKYSLWGQKLERELARIDPDSAPTRRFDADS